MNRILQGGWGIPIGMITATLSTIIIVGSFSLAFAEGNLLLPKGQTTQSSIQYPINVIQEIQTSSDTPQIEIPTQTLAPGSAETPPAPSADCPPPPGWIAVSIREGDSLDRIALEHNSSIAQLLQANCLVTDALVPGAPIYVPVTGTTATENATITPGTCTPPTGWVTYTVRSGDTLFGISRLFRISWSNLQSANCMGISTRLIAGQQIYVPNVSTSTPLPTRTSPPTMTASPPPPAPLPPGTNTPLPPTQTATATFSPTMTFTAIIPPSQTPTPSPTDTATPTFTATQTATPSITPTSTPSSTDTHPPTETPTHSRYTNEPLQETGEP
ncbi:MAG: LysM peptidoglycan-binding domain-containing protein [Anaerolineales bacterium]|nr:LysM peptidoglycan-binding domain-containing protein [Anaerolineales bacterium]